MKQKKLFISLVLILIIVLLVMKADKLVAHIYPYQYKELVKEWSEYHKVDPMLTLAVIRAESKFNEEATSKKGARGLMQLMPETAKWIGQELNKDVEIEKQDLFDPEISIKLGTWYLGRLQQQFGSYEYVAIASYNAGPGNVTRWIAAGTWDGTLTNIDNIPFAETRNYVLKVNRNHYIYSNLYAGDEMSIINRSKKNVELIKYLLVKAGF